MKMILNSIFSRFMLVIAALLAAVLLMPSLQAFAALPSGDLTQEQEIRPKGARIVLSSYSMVRDSSDDSITVRITLTNESVYDARSILVSYRDNSNTVMPIYGTSNQFYIASLAGSTSIDSEIKLGISGLTANDTFILNFTLDFYDNVVGSAQNTFYIGSTLGKTLTAIHTENIEVIGSPDDTGKTPVKFVLKNQVDYAVQNVELRIKGLLETEAVQQIPIGTIKANENITVEHLITLPEGRVQQVDVSLSYQDNEKKTITTKDESFTLYKYQSDQTSAQQQSSLNPFGSNWKKAVLYMGLLFIIVVALVINLRKKRLA